MTNLELTAQLLNITSDLMHIARQGDWTAFEALQAERMVLLQKLEGLEVSTDEVEPLRKRLVELRALNQQLVELADQKRDALLREKRALNKGRQMQNAYKS